MFKRARLVRDNLSGSFHFNSGDGDRQVLYGSDQTTCHSLPEEEPQYAEIQEVMEKIVDIHQPPPEVHSALTLPVTTPMEPDNTTETTSLLSDEQKQLSYDREKQLEEKQGEGEEKQDRELSYDRKQKQLTESMKEEIRKSLTETSFTDEIMMALREKLSDPNLYMTVMDAKEAADTQLSLGNGGEEEVYCAPIYSDPLSPD